MKLDVVVVGAGFAGLYMLQRLRGLGFSARVLEAGTGVGGTWYWNRYPGARCDVESLEYSYQFSDPLQQQWEWSERYAAQPEILRYANHVADRFDLRSDISFNARVKSAQYDEASGRWAIVTEKGESYDAQYLVMATGCLSSANLPDIKGRSDFAGPTYHTGQWPQGGVDFTGKTVGIIGTGSSAVQSIPLIAQQAKHLYVFQRTATYAVPARNAPLDPAVQANVKAQYPERRAKAKQTRSGILMPPNDVSAHAVSAGERNAEFERRWDEGGLSFLGAYNDLLLDKAANDYAAEFVRGKIRTVVKDSNTAELLCPRTVIGCKRLCIDTGYYQAFNRPNVTLVDVSQRPIEAIIKSGLRANGQDYRLNALIFATGFDAMTGSLLKAGIVGKGGKALKETWAEGPRTYLGLGTVDFPNLFTITGPGSPSVLTNMLPSIEQHVDWVADCLAYLRAKGLSRIEARPEAQEQWVGIVNMIAGATLFPTCNSWYLGANVPGKPRVFMPFLGFPPYVEKCNQVAANGYEGFALA